MFLHKYLALGKVKVKVKGRNTGRGHVGKPPREPVLILKCPSIVTGPFWIPGSPKRL